MVDLQLDGEQVSPDDTASFNFSAPSLVDEWDRVMGLVRLALTRNGDLIGDEVRTTYADNDNPVVKLDILIADGSEVATSTLFYKPDGYGYSFKAFNTWYVCDDAPYNHVGAKSGGFGVMYSEQQRNMNTVGPKSIYDAAMSLAFSENKKSMEKYFKDLCLIFMESARLHKIANYIRYAIQVTIDGGIALNEGIIPFPAKIRALYGFWGKFSKALPDFANGGVDAVFSIEIVNEILEEFELEGSFPGILREVAIVKRAE